MRRLTITFALCSLAGSAAAGQDSVLWRFAHPGARAMLGLEWKRLLDSPLGRDIKRELENSDLAAAAEGFNVLTDIERILVSSPGKRAGTAKQDAPVVIAVEGSFHLARVRQMAMGQDVSSAIFQGVEIITPKRRNGDSMALALVNEHIVLFGDRACVEAAIAAQGAAAPLARRAYDLARDNEFWLVADFVPWDMAAKHAPQFAMLREVTGLEAAVSLRQGLGLQFNMSAKSPQAAQSIAGGLTMFLNMAAVKAKDHRDVTDLLNKLRIATEGARVNIAMTVDEAELERSIASLREKRQELGVVAAQRVRTQGPKPPDAAPPAEKASIVVHGLEDGTREIPYRNP